MKQSLNQIIEEHFKNATRIYIQQRKHFFKNNVIKFKIINE